MVLQKHIANIKALEQTNPSVFSSLKAEWQKHSRTRPPPGAAAAAAARPAACSHLSRGGSAALPRHDGAPGARPHPHSAAPPPWPAGGRGEANATAAPAAEQWFRPNSAAPAQEEWFRPGAAALNGARGSERGFEGGGRGGRGAARPPPQAGPQAMQWQSAPMKRPGRGPRPPGGNDHGTGGPHGAGAGRGLQHTQRSRAPTGPAQGRGRPMRRV